MDSSDVGLNGQRVQPPASDETNDVKKADQKKGNAKKRKQTGQKASKKPSKRPRSENKTLKPAVPVTVGVKPNSSDHACVKADIGEGVKKAGKEGKKNTARKSCTADKAARKKKPKPRKAGKAVGKSNLSPPLNASTDKVLGEEGREGLDGPRESDQSSYLGELCGTEAEVIDEKIAHNGYRNLQEKAQTEVTEEHVPVVVEVGESTLINWEHFSLVYEEYCLTKEVNKGV